MRCDVYPIISMFLFLTSSLVHTSSLKGSKNWHFRIVSPQPWYINIWEEGESDSTFNSVCLASELAFYLLCWAKLFRLKLVHRPTTLSSIPHGDILNFLSITAEWINTNLDSTANRWFSLCCHPKSNDRLLLEQPWGEIIYVVAPDRNHR